MQLSDTSLKVANYRCFGEAPQGFDRVLPVNLIIGRNNTGKSALMDVVAHTIGVAKGWDREDWHDNRPPSIQMTFPADTDELKKQLNHSWQPQAMRKLKGRRATTTVVAANKRNQKLISIEDIPDSELSGYSLLAQLQHPMTGMSFRRIAAERDIKPENIEGYPEESDYLAPDGSGATSLMWMVTNDREYDSAWVEEELREELNTIIAPDARFDRIDLQYDSDQKTWEVYLDEPTKGRVSLSRSGSGLKTIVLILLNVLIWPRVQKTAVSLDSCCMAIEEPENNLHPALQRRLVRWLVDKANEEGFLLFVTSHSSAAIDMLASEDSAQILRVSSNLSVSEVDALSDRQSHFDVLDELGARASDVLLANGVIWVEGVSDAIYIRTWLKRYCDDQGLAMPVEGSEYAFVEYGGACLAHYDYSPRELADIKAMELEALLPALSLSRNAFVVMDSDLASAGGTLLQRKLDVIDASGDENVWVTGGREIESYLPNAVLNVAGRAGNLDRYAKFKDFTGSKREFALKAAAELRRTNGTEYACPWTRYDLESQMGRLLARIQAWNRL